MTNTDTTTKDNKPVCDRCKKEHSVREEGKDGDPVGSGSKLGRRLKRTKSSEHYVLTVKNLKSGEFRRIGSLQAHHLVLSSTCNNDKKLSDTVRKYGYDINHAKNGVLLPGLMDLACHQKKPVHNTNHDGGEAVADSTNVYTSYTTVVKTKAIKIINKYAKNKICESDDGLINDLNALSTEIRNKILSFAWTISEDGRDYAPGNVTGCGGADSLEKKHTRITEGTNICPHKHRIHPVVAQKLIEIAEKLKRK